MKKVIFINGASYTGKTWLHHKINTFLTNKNIDYSNICFEQCYRTPDAELSFYQKIKDKSKNRVVIAESVQFNKYLTRESLNIVCLPSLENHKENKKSVLISFGTDYANSRICDYTIEEIRSFFLKDFHYNPNTIIFDGKNLNTILDMVEKYVS